MSGTAGLCLGKYAPFHLGHKSVIDAALSETGRAVVLVYEDDVTPVPVHVRANWIRDIYAGMNVSVYKCYSAPQETGYTRAIMDAQERYLLKKLREFGESVTHFFSSEPYGEHVSRALGVVDRRVDQHRVKIPVSASAIRENSYRWRNFIPPQVYRDLVTKVVFLGSESTGKSTMARTAAGAYGTVFMPEYGAEYWFAHQRDGKLAPEQLLELARGHLEREQEKLSDADTYLFVDTNAITTYLYALDYHAAALPELTALAGACHARYDVTFLCGYDIPYDGTWDRRGKEKRRNFQKRFIGELKERRVPYVLLEGGIEPRMEKVRDILRRYDRWRGKKR